MNNSDMITFQMASSAICERLAHVHDDEEKDAASIIHTIKE